MKVKGKKILKNGAIGAYVYFPSDKKWKWRIIGNTKKKGGLSIEEKKYKQKENKYVEKKEKEKEKGKNIPEIYTNNISKRLWALHNTGFMNNFYKGVHKRYTTGSLDDTIQLLENRLQKQKYKK